MFFEKLLHKKAVSQFKPIFWVGIKKSPKSSLDEMSTSASRTIRLRGNVQLLFQRAIECMSQSMLSTIEVGYCCKYSAIKFSKSLLLQCRLFFNSRIQLNNGNSNWSTRVTGDVSGSRVSLFHFTRQLVKGIFC